MKVLAAASAALVSVAADNNINVINGTATPAGKYQYVSILRTTATSGLDCTAALVAPTVLLTTGDCATYRPQYASIGSRFLNGTGAELIKINKITIHPKFNPNTYDYDYAVVELAEASKHQPVKVALEDDSYVQHGKTSWVRGWGTYALGNTQFSPVLLEGDLPIFGPQECAKVYASTSLKPTERSICAGGLDKDWCVGDWGAPLTVFKNGKEELVGLASWGYECAAKGVPGVYSRLSAAREFLQPYLPKPSC